MECDDIFASSGASSHSINRNDRTYVGHACNIPGVPLPQQPTQPHLGGGRRDVLEVGFGLVLLRIGFLALTCRFCGEFSRRPGELSGTL